MQISLAWLATGFGALAFYASFSLHINKGGTCRGPCLEAECASGVRRVRFRRRDFAGGILSSSGRRRRQTKKPEGKTIRHRRAEALSGVLLFKARSLALPDRRMGNAALNCGQEQTFWRAC